MSAAAHPLTDEPTQPSRRPQLEVVDRSSPVDLARAERAVADLLAALGQDRSSAHLADTPRRVAASFAELLTPTPFTLTTFPNDEGYDELVLARAIPFSSLCQHQASPVDCGSSRTMACVSKGKLAYRLVVGHLHRRHPAAAPWVPATHGSNRSQPARDDEGGVNEKRSPRLVLTQTPPDGERP